MTTIADALKDEANRKLLSDIVVELDDWQLHEVDEEAEKPSLETIKVIFAAAYRDRVEIAAGLDTEEYAYLALELQDGQARLHAYGKNSDSPVTIEFTPKGIVINDQRD